MKRASTLKLNNGREIPVIGLGTYASGGSENKECQNAVESALACGYRHIDTACIYENEEEVGQGIRNSIRKGFVTRQEIFVTTKLWNDCHEYHKVLPTLQKSLKRLGLSYVDLYLMHWPMALKVNGTYADTDYLETWRGLEKCVNIGLAKSIGVSNFSIEQLERLIENCTIVPAVHQTEINLNLTQKDMIEYCKSKGIVLTAYSPFGSIMNPDMELSPRIDDPLLTALAKKYDKSVTQIVLRYLVDCGLAVIPKSITPSRIATNIDIFDFSLTPDEVAELDEFNKNFRVFPFEFLSDHKYYPF